MYGRHRVGLILLASLVALSATGCGGRKVFPVSGIVLFRDGTPLSGGWVVFEPVSVEGQVTASGDIQPNGTFSLSTEGKGDGAMAGWYRVVVHPPLTSNPSEIIPEPGIIHPKFQNETTTPLEFEVRKDAKPNHFRLEVERP